MTAARTQPLPNAIGNYRVIAQLGQGGMARAYLAIRQGPGGFRKLFVIKQLRRDLPSETAFVEMFLDEARLAAMLSHPNVVQTHEVGNDGADCFISMDYLEGQSLGRVLRRVTRAAMPLALHVQIIADVLAGLHYAHELNDFDGTPLDVVHRDVSPGNVFLTYDGQVKLLDFGIAKAVGANCQTEVGVLKGKLAYMAPEQALSGGVDRRSDIFSVGVMLWEALAQRRLVERSETEPVTLHNRVNGLWTPISEIRPDASAACLAACEKAMAVDPNDRFATADDFRNALLDCLAACGKEPSREELAELVTSQFVKEREALATKIAETIETGAQLPANEIPWRSSPSLTDIPVGALGEETVALTGGDNNEAVTTLRPQPSSPWRLALLIGGAAIAIAVAAIIYATQSGNDEQAAADEELSEQPSYKRESAAKVTSEPAGRTDERPPEKAQISLRVTTNVPSAVLELDGQSLASKGGYYNDKVARDNDRHRLVVKAEGYATSSRWLRFDEDIDIEVKLEGVERVEPSTNRARIREARIARERAAKKREAELAAAEAEAARAAEPAAKTIKTAQSDKVKAGDSLKAPDRKKPRTIDEKNPYQ